MLEEDRGTVKHSVAYGAMEPRRKRWVWMIASVTLACLGAGAGVGVLFERTFHRDGHAAAAVTTSINTSTTPTLTAPSTSAVSSTTSSATRSVFYLVGDSHTQFGSDVNGWATRLQSLYVRSVDVLNRGLADFNTQQFVEAGLPIVAKELASSSFTPMVITLWFGLDDAALSDGPAARHQVHVDKYYDNLVHILRTFRKQSPRSKILVVSPLVVDDDTRRQVLVQRDELSGPIDRTNNMTKAYAAAAAEAASVLRDLAISHLDLYSYLMETYPNTTARAALFRDGLHLNEEGHRVVFEQVRTRIELIVPASMLQTAQIPLPETARVGH